MRTISYVQHGANGSNPWVGGFDTQVRKDNGGSLEGRVVADSGSHFAIRFPGRGTYVYKREDGAIPRSGWAAGSSARDHAELVIIL